MGKTKRKRRILIICGILILALAIELYVSNNVLTVSEYSVKADVKEPIRIVQLTDLHNKQFGKDNYKLIEKVKEQEPEYIFMTGDMINETDEDLSIITQLIHSLSKIAPVYYSYGNHEESWEGSFPDHSLSKQLKEAGAIVLDDDYMDVELNGFEARLGGYYGYYRRPVMTTQDPEKKEWVLNWCQEYEDTDRYKILLCHIPTPWLDWDYINQYPEDIQYSDYYNGKSPDLVFSGHYHGGQIRIPGIGGLFVPYVKCFPKFTKGLFVGEETTCVLSAGLGSYGLVPRVFNPPELISLTIG